MIEGLWTHEHICFPYDSLFLLIKPSSKLVSIHTPFWTYVSHMIPIRCFPYVSHMIPNHFACHVNPYVTHMIPNHPILTFPIVMSSCTRLASLASPGRPSGKIATMPSPRRWVKLVLDFTNWLDGKSSEIEGKPWENHRKIWENTSGWWFQTSLVWGNVG